MDLEEKLCKELAETRAWNFQQGAMLHWMPSEPNSKIIFNDTDGERVFSRILDIHTGEEKSLPMGINAVGNTKDIALCINFARLRKARKVVSYPCATTSVEGSHPDNDGIYLMA